MATEMTNVFSANPGATGDDVELVVGDVSANDVALDVGEDAAEVAVDAAAATTAVGNAAASEEEGMDLDLGLRVLKSIPMLQHIHDTEMRKLIKALGRERFGAGVDVFKQGEVGRTFYIIREGEVGVLKSTDGGEPVFCATLGHNQSFGIQALLNNAPRTTTIRTKGPVECFVLSQDKFAELLGPAAALTAAYHERPDVRSVPRSSPIAQVAAADGAAQAEGRGAKGGESKAETKDPWGGGSKEAKVRLYMARER